MDLNCNFKTAGLKSFQAEWEGSLPSLAIHRGKEKTVIEGKGLKGAIHIDKNKTAFSLTELTLENPRLTMSGTLLVDKGRQQVRLELEGREVDVASIRKAALTIAGDVANIRKVFDIVKGGKVPLISLTTHGSTMADLGNLGNMLIKGQMADGKILVPKADLDLDDVKGDAVISRGIMKGEYLEARLGKSIGYGGSLELGLAGHKAPFHLNMIFQADLAQIPSLLKGLIKSESFVREINLAEDIKGSALGRLILGGSPEAIKPRVDVSEFNLSARYGRVPHPLEIKGGHLSYHEDGIDVESLSGTMRGSSFSGLSARVDWKEEAFLKVKSGESVIILEEIHPWLASFENLSPLKDLKTLEGTVAISNQTFKGPLLEPENWQFKTSGEVRHLKVDSARFPGPIDVTGGKFDALGGPEDQNLTFKDARVTVLDASLNVSGAFEDYLKGLDKFEIRLQGDVGPDSNQWISSFIHMPSEFILRSPLSVSGARLAWEKGTKTSFEGNLTVQNGPGISLDIAQTPDEFTIRDLIIKDKESKAHLALNLKKREFHVKFAGHLTKTTTDRLLAESKLPDGSLEGDIRAHILMDRPMRSTAQGELKGQDLIFPMTPKAPLKINSISLGGEKNRINIESADLTWGENNFMLKGDLNFSEKGMLFGLDLSSDGLDWGHIKNSFEKQEKERGDEQTRGLWSSPVRGTLRLKSKYLKHEPFTWEPFHAVILLNSTGLSVKVTEAKLCGISTPGILKVTSQDLSLDLKPVSKGRELDDTVTCLSRETTKMTGTFDLKGELKARAKPEELAHSLQGRIEFVAKKGRFYRDIMLHNIFDYLNVTETFFGKFPGIGKKGIGYDSITIKAHLRDGKLELKEVVMDGDSMELACQGYVDLIRKKMDLNILVSPLKTVDRVVKKTPLLKHVLAGTLVSIPLKISGDLSNPKVHTLAPSAMGSGLLGIMKRTFQLPIKIIEPVLPE